MKTVLIFLASLAVVLGLFAYFAVFGAPTGSYAVTPIGNPNTDIVSSSPLGEITSTSSVTSTISFADSSSTGDNGTGASASGTTGSYGSAFATPPLSWSETGAKISITAAALEGNQLTFSLAIANGAAPACIPLNVRLVADEEGDLNPPNPASFAFSDSGNCNAAPNATYANQTATFVVDPGAFPLLFTTGGASNIYFEVVTSTNNGLNVVFPGTSG